MNIRIILGDDPYWEAVNLHYWPTGDLEWYDPQVCGSWRAVEQTFDVRPHPQAIATKNGKLVLTMDETPIANLSFRSGMLQSWNKFCFTTGYVEVSVSMPGAPTAPGLWPGIWTMGNLVRHIADSSLNVTYIATIGPCRLWSNHRRNVAIQLRHMRSWHIPEPNDS